ncbi:sulfate transporter family-domain-containing protein [Piptocephalis cylindrospora]|uniref:Sulfate transporter family-domain-containing protein n=1 Tax=Piptocephalis cylindrospora TaxID=1907219 RepID=A0A4P9Y4A0_9FUNG|nr:sulfate transporter family-domain-containing protein [Piptocephalis cylindrospora]|eukprot:RKP13673.1 sulfate transporter family-domain-containing protein [Piptocephalis cylindrospora]
MRKPVSWRQWFITESSLTIHCIPAVFLGLILNILDAVSYGMIIFPLSIPLFSTFGPDGISMFLFSAVISQVCYSGGLSMFGGSNGNMMDVREAGGSDETIVATTMVAYSLSTILTGIVFMALGYWKLGSLVEFFPRHILVGCIGGVGYFLLQTGFEVTTRLDLSLSLATLKDLFSLAVFPLWLCPFVLALLLRALQLRFHHPMVVPLFFLVVPCLFYALVPLGPWSLEDLRDLGWLFPLPKPAVPFYDFWTKFNFAATSWSTIPRTIPIMLGLTFFGILHVPINVPALGVSTGRDVDTNRELVAHGWSNLLAGFTGTIQNYLVYSNSVLFIRCGGDSRRAGLLLALFTFLIFLGGPWVVGYIPSMVVGALIFHLGMELLKEAVWDTRDALHPLEYTTVWLIVISMGAIGFMEGILLGVLAACLFFVILYSRRRTIRLSCSGRGLRSRVKRPYRQGRYLDEATRQIHILQLQGFLFFGTVGTVEREIHQAIGSSSVGIDSVPIRYMILDFALVSGLDFSAAEAFIRTKRALDTRGVHLIFCGVSRDGDVGKALRKAMLWGGEDDEEESMESGGFDGKVRVFPSLNEALESCENALLRHFYRQRQHLAAIEDQGDHLLAEPLPPSSDSPPSPRLPRAPPLSSTRGNYPQPLGLLMQAFQELGGRGKEALLHRISSHFTSRDVREGEVLWREGDVPDGLALVESGLLRASVRFEGRSRVVESVLPSTVCGEMDIFTESGGGGRRRRRGVTMQVERRGRVWWLSLEAWEALKTEDPATALGFMSLALGYSAQGMDTLVVHALHIQG